jgi:hypothetical protein
MRSFALAIILPDPQNTAFNRHAELLEETA